MQPNPNCPDALRVPIRERFPREQLRAVVLAYRTVMAEGYGAGPAGEAAKAAYLAHGGDPAQALREPGWMIATVATQHGEWFWRPVKARLEHEEAALRWAGQWPGPLPQEERRRVAATAMAAMEAARNPAEAAVRPVG